MPTRWHGAIKHALHNVGVPVMTSHVVRLAVPLVLQYAAMQFAIHSVQANVTLHVLELVHLPHAKGAVMEDVVVVVVLLASMVAMVMYGTILIVVMVVVQARAFLPAQEDACLVVQERVLRGVGVDVPMEGVQVAVV